MLYDSKLPRSLRPDRTKPERGLRRCAIRSSSIAFWLLLFSPPTAAAAHALLLLRHAVISPSLSPTSPPANTSPHTHTRWTPGLPARAARFRARVRPCSSSFACQPERACAAASVPPEPNLSLACRSPALLVVPCCKAEYCTECLTDRSRCPNCVSPLNSATLLPKASTESFAAMMASVLKTCSYAGCNYQTTSLLIAHHEVCLLCSPLFFSLSHLLTLSLSCSRAASSPPSSSRIATQTSCRASASRT